MALVIEDGSEVSGANSYASYAELVAYGLLRGVTVTATQADGEALLMQAMDALYGRPWKGERVTTTQSLEWPRTGVYRDGQLLAYDEIPRELSYGQLSLAIAAIDNTLMGVAAATDKGSVIEERVEGAITVKYANSGKVYNVAAVADAEALLRVLERNSGLNLVRA